MKREKTVMEVCKQKEKSPQEFPLRGFCYGTI
jgi:hypothetical protein